MSKTLSKTCNGTDGKFVSGNDCAKGGDGDDAVDKTGSNNFVIRKKQGWVEGSAKYTSEEPHHVRDGDSWTYVTMHNEKLESRLAAIIEGTGKIGDKVEGVSLRWNEKDGFSLLRSTGSVIEEVSIPNSVVSEFNGNDIGGEFEDHDATLEIQKNPMYKTLTLMKNCGTGDGGFQVGNTCSKSGGDGSEKVSVRGILATELQHQWIDKQLRFTGIPVKNKVTDKGRTEDGKIHRLQIDGRDVVIPYKFPRSFSPVNENGSVSAFARDELEKNGIHLDLDKDAITKEMPSHEELADAQRMQAEIDADARDMATKFLEKKPLKFDVKALGESIADGHDDDDIKGSLGEYYESPIGDKFYDNLAEKHSAINDNPHIMPPEDAVAEAEEEVAQKQLSGVMPKAHAIAAKILADNAKDSIKEQEYDSAEEWADKAIASETIAYGKATDATLVLKDKAVDLQSALELAADAESNDDHEEARQQVNEALAIEAKHLGRPTKETKKIASDIDKALAEKENDDPTALIEHLKAFAKADPSKAHQVVDIIEQLGGDSSNPDITKTIDPKKYRSLVSNAASETVEPTEAQAEAGNYKKGKVRIHGLIVSIENPKGTRRQPEWPELSSHYGYLNRTVGKDGDHVDVFIGPHPKSEIVYIIDQPTQDGKFDEHKVMLGWYSKNDATEAYLANYTPKWKLGDVTSMTVEQFKEWLENGDQTKPAARANYVKKNLQISDESLTKTFLITPEQRLYNSPFDLQTLPMPGTELDADTAHRLVTRLRAGHPESKNKGYRSVEPRTGPLVVGDVPISAFNDSHIRHLRVVADPERVASYVAAEVKTPIYVDKASITDHLFVNDGACRLLAAIDRGATHVNALMSREVFDLHNHILDQTITKSMRPIEKFRFLMGTLTKTCNGPDGKFVTGNDCSSGGDGTADSKADSNGKQKQTDSPQFKKWFGASKVTNDDGSPLVVYHGTDKDFSEFNNPYVGTGWNMFSESPEYASKFAVGEQSHIKPVYLSIQKPLDLSSIPARRSDARVKLMKLFEKNGLDVESLNKIIPYEKDLFQLLNSGRYKNALVKHLQDHGFDGIKMPDVHGDLEATTWITFTSGSVKSATGNLGKFDSSNPDITKTVDLKSETA